MSAKIFIYSVLRYGCELLTNDDNNLDRQENKWAYFIRGKYCQDIIEDKIQGGGRKRDENLIFLSTINTMHIESYGVMTKMQRTGSRGYSNKELHLESKQKVTLNWLV